MVGYPSQLTTLDVAQPGWLGVGLLQKSAVKIVESILLIVLYAALYFS